jgi:hypothetical protein
MVIVLVVYLVQHSCHHDAMGYSPFVDVAIQNLTLLYLVNLMNEVIVVPMYFVSANLFIWSPYHVNM